jgi:uncharacterized membrane protein
MRRSLLTLHTLLATLLIASACADSRTVTAPQQSIPKASATHDAATPTFTSLEVPGATFTLALDINETGVIVGRYLAAGHTHGFERDVYGAYTTIDFPGSSFTVAASVNDSGAVTGWYTLPATPAVRHGFILRDGAFATIDPPGSVFTNVLGINERGDVVGRYCTVAPCLAPGNGSYHAFMYSDGAFTTIDVSGAHESDAFKISANGTVVGGFTPIGGPEQLFVLSHDDLTTSALSNGKSVALDDGGLNARGDIVGTYCDSGFPCLLGPTGTHGFLLTKAASFTTIDYPGAVATAATGINARGDIVGGWSDSFAVTRGFLLTSK